MNPFFAYINRLKLIQRWGLMRNAIPENDMEHSMQCALIAHALALLAKTRYQRDVDPQTAATLALYHDAGEVMTGDLPTPVKYKNTQIKRAYKQIETMANQQLFQMLPDDLKPAYSPYLLPDTDTYAWKLVKAADRICAYLKCVDEKKTGNLEFVQAQSTIKASIAQIDLPEVQDFMREFAPAYELSLDELSKL
ncbi:MAG TPA: 5'-deoxynucleotidase [Candidatus Limiplasma sp.]|nr:5'-deoxynucleotidase [Candidatus Limiplasma sp.]